MAIFTNSALSDRIMRSGVSERIRKLVRDVAASVFTSGSSELTASGAVPAGTQLVELNHATVAVAATMAPPTGGGLVVIKDTSASGTAAHTLTLTSGTLNATGNNKATLNASKECLIVYFDSNGNGNVVENLGSVALSTV